MIGSLMLACKSSTSGNTVELLVHMHARRFGNADQPVHVFLLGGFVSRVRSYSADGNLTTTCLHPEATPQNVPTLILRCWTNVSKAIYPVIVLSPGLARMLICYESTLVRLRVTKNNIPHIHHGAHILFGFSCAISV